MKNDTYPYQIILFEGNGATSLATERRREVTRTLLDKGYSVTRVTEDGGRNLSNPSGDIPVLILGDFEGNSPEVTSRETRIEIDTEDITGLDTETIITLVEQKRAGDGEGLNSPGEQGAWKPWFPVIDYDRCTNCMQCLSFCLFDVYGVDEEKQIQVQNNDNCKTNCPACSRVCPEVAIMFPKYSSGPINGAEVAETDVAREKMKVDITSLLGGDIYASLRTRSEKAKSRFSKERSPDKALNERKRCLTKLQQSGIIPAEVLAELDLESLPSPDEIQRKATEFAKMQAEADS
ncbi:MAG: ferredoxin family protein [Verrucomicrobiales bacterium]|nr:ferredoxin family protein [Verrucomicrobiales bacterium]